MKLDTEFYKLPLGFDAERLAQEVAQFAESEWRPHPQGYPGNSALILIAVDGDANNDLVKGPMRPTPHLDRCPYLQQVLGALGTVLGRTRLMRLGAQAEATAHIDMNYYWFERVRVHVPIVTFPEVSFLCNDKSVHMAPGETWIFDTWKLHNVLNPTSHSRIHLVVDTVGSAYFWDLVAKSERPHDRERERAIAARFLPYEPGKKVVLETESVNFPVVMSPWEQQKLVDLVLEGMNPVKDNPSDLAAELKGELLRFCREWRSLWAQYGAASPGWPLYRQVLDNFKVKLDRFETHLNLQNGMDVAKILREFLITPSLNGELAGQEETPSATVSFRSPVENEKQPASPRSEPAVFHEQPIEKTTQTAIDRPIFIVAAPRSGSTLLFETLGRCRELWTIGKESHEIFEGIAKLQPANRQFASNRLTEADADPETAATLRQRFLEGLRDRQNQPLPPGTASVRMLEKTPKNSLRIPFLRAVFPDARFIYLYRQPQENISSIMEAWRSKKFVTYPKLPEWEGLPWSLLLIPGWRQLQGKPLPEIAAEQWRIANQYILDDLETVASDRKICVTYADLLADPQAQAKRLCEFAGLEWDVELPSKLPFSRHTLTPPNPNKWKKNAAEIETILPKIEGTAVRAQKAIAGNFARTLEVPERGNTSLVTGGEIHLQSNQMTAPSDSQQEKADLKSVYTSNLPQILEKRGISLVVSTYQAGKLIAVRADGGTVNTHFRGFKKPMGLAADRDRLAIGTAQQIWELANVPEAGRKLEPQGKHDACYVPRNSYVTGDIDIHEMSWAGKELWFVNTRFSCLCTLDTKYNFVPRWRPPFVTALEPTDRCHLNSFTIVNGKPKYATALGETNVKFGWRENKANGGVLIDVEENKVLLRGLSMPHSPRWYAGKLWLLESGKGTLTTVDLATGQLKVVAELPGFTRGLDFSGPFAFIGLSQVRETAAFSGIPITERIQERTCGVWVVNIETGQTVGFLRFEQGVEEIFAIQVLHGIRFPEIIDWDEQVIGSTFILPDEALADVELPEPAAVS